MEHIAEGDLQARDELGAMRTLVEFTRCLDLRDWTRLSGLLHDTVHWDYSSLLGGRPEVLPRGQLCDRLEGLAEGSRPSQHIVSGLMVTPGPPGRCRVSADVISLRFADARPVAALGGVYALEMVRAEGRAWTISELTLRVAWRHASSSDGGSDGCSGTAGHGGECRAG